MARVLVNSRARKRRLRDGAEGAVEEGCVGVDAAGFCACLLASLQFACGQQPLRCPSAGPCMEAGHGVCHHIGKHSYLGDGGPLLSMNCRAHAARRTVARYASSPASVAALCIPVCLSLGVALQASSGAAPNGAQLCTASREVAHVSTTPRHQFLYVNTVLYFLMRATPCQLFTDKTIYFCFIRVSRRCRDVKLKGMRDVVTLACSHSGRFHTYVSVHD